MAEENQNISHGYQQPPVAHEESAEIKDRGVFDFLGKKKEEEAVPHQNVGITNELEHVHVSGDQCQEPEKHHSSLLQKLHRSDSSSSSSSEEVEENGEKIRRKKKKGLKERIHGHKSHEEDTTVPVVKYENEEKKGVIEKIKEKLPGHKKTEEHAGVPCAPTGHPVAVDHHEYGSTAEAAHHHEAEETKEKKGFLEKIKEKLPGYHKNEDEEKKASTPTGHY